MTGETTSASASSVLEAVVAAAPFGVAVADADGEIVQANDALAAFLGLVPGALQGRRWIDLVADDDRGGVHDVEASLRVGARARAQLAQRWRHADGSFRLADVTVAAVRGDPGRPGAWVLHVAPADVEPDIAEPGRGRQPAMAGTAVQEAAAELADAVTLEQVTNVMEEQVLAAFGADGLLISLVEGPRLRLVTCSGYPQAAEVALSDLSMDDVAPMVEVVHRRTPMFVGSRHDYAVAYPERAEVTALTGKRAWAFLPLIAGGRAIGSWTLSFDRGRPFSIPDRALLITLSGLLAQAVARAQAVDAERSLARALQGSLLPAELPPVPHADIAVRYRPAVAGVAVGGDFYDVVHVPGGGVSVVVGDVQGHSTEAAAVMGQVRSALRAYAAEGHDPAAVVTRANRFLFAGGIETFVTCAYAHLDPGTGRLLVVRAGHVPPLRLRDGVAALLDVAGGLPLGIAEDATYEAEEVLLAPGDRFVLFTDGLVETRNASIDDGHDALAARATTGAELPLEPFADALLDDDVNREDDVALLVVDYAGPSGDAADRARFPVTADDPRAVSRVRRAVVAETRHAGWATRADDVALLVGELITNAVVHATGPVEVTLTAASRELTV